MDTPERSILDCYPPSQGRSSHQTPMGLPYKDQCRVRHTIVISTLSLSITLSPSLCFSLSLFFSSFVSFFHSFSLFFFLYLYFLPFLSLRYFYSLLFSISLSNSFSLTQSLIFFPSTSFLFQKNAKVLSVATLKQPLEPISTVKFKDNSKIRFYEPKPNFRFLKIGI